MGQWLALIRRFFTGKKEADRAGDDALCRVFRKRYLDFQMLLRSNHKALEIMADMERALDGKLIFDMPGIRARCTVLFVNLFQMIGKLDQLAPGRYPRLSDRLSSLQESITQILGPDTGGPAGPLILGFDDAEPGMERLLGNKMATLCEIRNHTGVEVPDGFVFTVSAYRLFVTFNNMEDEIARLLQSVNRDSMEELCVISVKIQDLIRHAAFPDELMGALKLALAECDRGGGQEVRFAVRSSAIEEDLEGRSFAGQYKTVLNVRPERLPEAYKEVIAGKYSVRAITYSQNIGFHYEGDFMAVGCMVMVDPLSSGVLYTKDPVGKDDGSVYISAAWGLPGSVVDGSIDGDLFTVSRDEPHGVIRREIRDKKMQMVLKPGGGVASVPNPENLRCLPCLNREQVRQLTRVAMALEHRFKGFQDIEWAFAKGERPRLYILQSRPLKADRRHDPPRQEIPESLKSRFIAGGGTPVCSGAASGRVFGVKTMEDALRFEEGSILLVFKASPEWSILLPRAAGIITERGSYAGHLASVAREYGVPALFGVPCAMDNIRHGDDVTMDTRTKGVYAGRAEILLHRKGRTGNGFVKSPVYRTLQAVAALVLPLHLMEPESPDFAPDHCRSLHDLTRFVHEKAIRAMFSFGREHHCPAVTARQLHHKTPLKWWVLNLDDGFRQDVTGKYVRLSDIVSTPMLALWEGMTAFEWDGPPPVDGKGLLSVMFRATMDTSLLMETKTKYATKNYFIISKEFCHLSSRLGFHFATMESFVSHRTTENYVVFTFQGGAADEDRKCRRVRFVGDLLSEYGYTVNLRGDRLEARIEGRDGHFMETRLRILGYLFIHTRQLDMIMSNPSAVDWYGRKFRNDLKLFTRDHDRRDR